MKRFKPRVDHSTEFEIDLAPLLAVMVKLVPVLLISSAFVQMSIIETELPQVVQEAIQKQEKENPNTNISLDISSNDGFKIFIHDKGQSKSLNIPLKNSKLDYEGLHLKLVEVKKEYPQIFKIEFNPEANVPYEEIIKAMDETRQAKDNIVFPVMDTKTGKQAETKFMFPEVIFANMLDSV